MHPDALKCNICPKKPNFSDVSHLLTHVSSKGHLSHFFKLQVRSHQEPEAGQTLDAYNKWYNENNLAYLLSDRMKAKEARKSKEGGRGSDNNNNHKRGSNGSRPATAREPPADRGRVGTANGTGFDNTVSVNGKGRVPSHVLDPRLTQPYPLGPISDSRRNELQPLQTANHAAHGVDTQSFMPVPVWPLGQQQHHHPSESFPPQSMQNGFKREPSSEPEETIVSPLARKARSRGLPFDYYNSNPSSRPQRPMSPDPFVDNDASFQDGDEDEENDARTSEMTKLKGILWPGMDIFDAATEHMRRKRNQKKDGTILKQMEKTSETVTPTELVFSPSGTLRKERLIYSMIEDSSPLKGETPIPKRRIPKQKKPARPVDPSLRHGKTMGRPRKNTRNQSHQPTQLEQLSAQDLPLLGSPGYSNESYNYGNYLYTGETGFKLPFSDGPTRLPPGFAIFNDDKKQLGGPHGSETLSDITNFPWQRQANGGPFMGANPPSRNGHSKPSTRYESKSHARPGEMNQGKENVDPMLSQLGRLNMPPSGMPWGEQRPAGHSPRPFGFGGGFHGGYGGFMENDPFGYSHNPLSSYPFPTMPQTVNGKDVCPRANDLFMSPERKPAKDQKPVSPDGTISDLDKDDFGQIYIGSEAK